GGQFRDALRSANDAIVNDSRYGPAFALRSRVWRVLGDATHEKEDAARALSLIGGGKLDADALVAQSAAHLAIGRFDK
ncbi:hypothetical protein, partial [Pseudomonas aeruginosa]|uniref:hypothetical protein n=1 Tax=Pseudomonas aeruginosa TaxID=287 RepID=UPI002884BE12